jgi:hypothetical protein
VLGRLKSSQLGAKLGDLLPIRIELCRAPRSASRSKARRGQREAFLAAGRLHSHSALPLRNEPRARWKCYRLHRRKIAQKTNLGAS